MDWRTDKQGRLLWTSSGKHGDQNGHPKLENNLFHAKKHFGLSQDMPEERCIPPGKVFKEHKGLYSERLRYQNVPRRDTNTETLLVSPSSPCAQFKQTR